MPRQIAQLRDLEAIYLDRPFVAYDPIIGTPHVRTVQDRLQQCRLRVRPRRVCLQVFGATRALTGVYPTSGTSRRCYRFCCHHTSLKRSAYLRCAMFRHSVTGVAGY